MKTSFKLFSFFLATSLAVACASGESETLKQARTIQTDIMNQTKDLDSTINVKLESVNSELTILNEDSTMQTDSVKLAGYMTTKDKYNELTTLKSDLADWKSNVVMLPTVEEMANGAENPFGEKAKDQEVLASIKKSQDDFSAFRTKAEASMK